MMAYLTRRESFAEGSPPPKPYNALQFKEKTDTLIQGIYGTEKSSNASLVDLMQKELNKAVEEGVVTMEEGIEFIKSRKNYYDNYIKEQSKTTDEPVALPRSNFAEGSKKYDYKDPQQKNQYVMRSDSEIQKIINNPKYKDYTRKDFRNEKILTRKETERKGLEFKNFGKKVKVNKRATQNIKQSAFIKGAQGSSISMDKINNFAHYAPKLKTYLVSTSDTGPLKATVNRAAEGYDKEALKIAQKQETLLKDKPKNYKEQLIKENYKAANLSKKANKELPKGLKGTLGYFVVNPDTGKFTLKGVDKAKTFAGISGEKKEFIKMAPSERKSFGPTQSAIQALIDSVKKKVPGANIMRASNAPIPNAKNLDMFKKANIRLGMPGGSGDRPLKDPLGGQIDLIDVKELIKKPYDNT